MYLTKFRILTLLLIQIMILSCTPVIGPFSPTSYQNATTLKAETLALMDKATEPYDAHVKDADRLFVELNKAYEYDKGLMANNITTKQWEILIKKDGDLIGSFFSIWAKNKPNGLSPVFISEFRQLVSDSFDELICLEANKKEHTECKARE